MMFKSNLTILICSVLCLLQSLAGQDYIYSTYDITTADGLLSKRVSVVYQDADGFIWLRTLDGVGRFDGHNIKWFTKSNTNLQGIPRANLMVEDAEGYFWFTDGNHIDLMHRKTFEVITLGDKFPEEVPFTSSIEQFWQGPDGSVYMKTLDTETFYHYHPQTGFTVLPHLQGAGSVYAKPDGLWANFQGSRWIKFDYKTNEVLKSFEAEFGADWIIGFRKQEDWFCYFSSTDTTFVIANVLDDSTIEEFLRIPTKVPPPGIRNMLLYNAVEDQLLINFPLGGHSMVLLDFASRQTVPLKKVFGEEESTYQNSLFVDNKGIYWQNSPKGLTLVKVSKPIFSRYAKGYATRGLWANDQHLVLQFRYVDFQQPDEVKQIEGLSRIQSIFYQEKDELWLGGSLGIAQLDPVQLSIINQYPVRSDHAIWSILRDQEGRWWGGLYQQGLLLKTPEDSIVRPYQQYGDFPELQNSRVLQLIEEGPFLWAVTNRGLYLVHKEQGVIRRYWVDAEQDYRLPFEDIHFLHKDANNVYWVATNADGLVRFELDRELKVKTHKRYTSDDDLSSNILYAIVEDQFENLWISSLNGLSCFNKKTEDVRVFLEEDGLTELEFNRLSHFKDKNGRIYFGSIDGVVSFRPEDITVEEEYVASIRISELTVYNAKNEQLIEQDASNIKNIVLEPNARFFHLRVSMLDFFNVDRLRYSYKIEGLYDDYQSIDGNTIELGGLPFGEYTLRVRGQSSDRRYSTEELVIPLTVLRPVYYRWWFILLVLSVLTATIVQYYYWRIQQLKERRLQLELMVYERTNQVQKDKAIIEEQAARLQELDQVKSQFFANISHELRTPLTLILAPLEGILKRNLQNNRDYTSLRLMQQNGQKLLKRINELLDLSRLDAQKLAANEAPTFLYAFLKSTFATFEGTANAKSIQLLLDYRLDEQLQLLLDIDKVEKIISNYLSNALKFTASGGQIILRAEKAEGQLLLSVADTGIGILPEDLDRIFNRFYQSTKNDQLSGSGIGLALCKELAKVLDAEVWASSELAKGSIFYLELQLIETFANISLPAPTTTLSEPVVKLPEVKPAPEAAPKGDHPTILVVEDNADLRQYISLLLNDSYQVVAVEHGKAALEYLESAEKPALIVSDLMMPIMDGLELLKQLKTREDWCLIPVIILTARQSTEVKIDALRIGVDDYLTKPFKEEELLVRISNLIQKRQHLQQSSPTNEAPEEESIAPVDLEWLRSLEEIIVDQLSNPKFKLSEAATAMNMSYRRLQQKLKAITGLTPKQYQRSIKLAKARTLLKSGQFQTVTEVIYQLGFDNHHYFSKLYKEEFGIMPSEEL